MRALSGILMVLVGCSFDTSGVRAGDHNGGPDANIAIAGDGGIAADATPASGCRDLCPGLCTGEVCHVDCTANNSCRDFVCPAAIACVIDCGGERSCRNLSCGAATSCEVHCTGSRSCEDGLDCGAGACDVLCTGEESCKNGVHCAESCACSVFCGSADATCESAPSCPSGCSADSGCTTSGAGCNTCL